MGKGLIPPATAVLLAGIAAAPIGHSGSLPTVSCDLAVLRPRSITQQDRVVLGRVATTFARVYQVAEVGGRLHLWSKIGLYVRAGRTPVTVVVPRAWRGRAAVTWGDSGVVRALRVAACPSPPNVWNGYAGGFYVRGRACVPLVVGVGGRTKLIRFGIGRPCAGSA